MPRAFILVGNAARFCDDGKRFRHFLKSKVGLKHISFVESCRTGALGVETKLKKFFSGRKTETRIIFYSGHGNKNGWALDDDQSYSYDALAQLLYGASSPCMLINQTCHSLAVKNFFEKYGVDRNRITLIASCDEDEAAYVDLLSEVIECWRNRAIFRPSRDLHVQSLHVGEVPGIDSYYHRWVISQFPKIGSDGELMPAVPLPTPEMPVREPIRLYFKGKRWGSEKHDHHFFVPAG